MAEITITQDNFQTEVLESEIPVLVDFWATWCGPCQMLAPVIEEVANENEGKFKVGKVNVDEEPGLARQFRVMSIPTLIVFNEGKVVNQSIGVIQKEDVVSLVETAV